MSIDNSIEFQAFNAYCRLYMILTIPIISSRSSFRYIASTLTLGPHRMQSFAYAFLQLRQNECPQGMIVMGSLMN